MNRKYVKKMVIIGIHHLFAEWLPKKKYLLRLNKVEL